MQKTSIYIDISTRSQITEWGAPVDRSAMFPAIERGQWQVMCYTFVTRTESLDGTVLTPVELDNNAAYVLVADDNFDDDDNLMLKSYQSVVPFDESDPTSNMFNIEGDWIDGGTADMSLGQLSVRVNSDTVKFASVLGDSEVKSSGLYQCIKQFFTGHIQSFHYFLDQIQSSKHRPRLEFCTNNPPGWCGLYSLHQCLHEEYAGVSVFLRWRGLA